MDSRIFLCHKNNIFVYNHVFKNNREKIAVDCRHLGTDSVLGRGKMQTWKN